MPPPTGFRSWRKELLNCHFFPHLYLFFNAPSLEIASGSSPGNAASFLKAWTGALRERRTDRCAMQSRHSSLGDGTPEPPEGASDICPRGFATLRPQPSSCWAHKLHLQVRLQGRPFLVPLRLRGNPPFQPRVQQVTPFLLGIAEPVRRDLFILSLRWALGQGLEGGTRSVWES